LKNFYFFEISSKKKKKRKGKRKGKGKGKGKSQIRHDQPLFNEREMKNPSKFKKGTNLKERGRKERKKEKKDLYGWLWSATSVLLQHNQWRSWPNWVPIASIELLPHPAGHISSIAH